MIKIEKHLFTDVLLLGPVLVNTTQDEKTQALAEARAAEIVKRAEANAALTTLVKFDDGMHDVTDEIDKINTHHSPTAREAEIVLALTAGPKAIKELSVIISSRAAHKAFLIDVRTYGREVARPKLVLESLHTNAEHAEAVADVAGGLALESAGKAMQAGAAIRALEGTSRVYPENGKTDGLMKEARRLYGIAGQHWIGYYDERSRQERNSK